MWIRTRKLNNPSLWMKNMMVKTLMMSDSGTQFDHMAMIIRYGNDDIYLFEASPSAVTLNKHLHHLTNF